MLGSVFAGLTAYIMNSFKSVDRDSFYSLERNKQSVSCVDRREGHFIHLSFTLHSAVVGCSGFCMSIRQTF